MPLPLLRNQRPPETYMRAVQINTDYSSLVDCVWSRAINCLVLGLSLKTYCESQPVSRLCRLAR